MLLAVWVGATAGLAIAYFFIVEGYRSGWHKLPEWTPSPSFSPSVKISVILPARNEAAKIVDCLHSIAAQTYPTTYFEVLVLDDHSEDETFSLAQNFTKNLPNFRAVRLADFQVNSKKKAIETGISLATGELIVCTDADCILPQDWLQLLAPFFEEKQAKFIAAPVNFCEEKNWLQRFQSLDFLGMMGVTGAGFQTDSGLLCNGANLAYPKSVFYEVGGFEGIDGLASGDDMLLLHKVASRYPDAVFFLKNRGPTVLTEAQPDLRSFLSQRLRWASKSRSYTDRQVTARLGVAFLTCWAILLNLAFAVWLGWPFAMLTLSIFLMKTLVDYRFLNEMCRYFDRRDLMRRYLISQILHIAYIVVVGTLANLVKQYKWKGRQRR